eukprot:10642091-Alexandrium_andersonii.AAC.1
MLHAREQDLLVWGRALALLVARVLCLELAADLSRGPEGVARDALLIQGTDDASRDSTLGRAR